MRSAPRAHVAPVLLPPPNITRTGAFSYAGRQLRARMILRAWIGPLCFIGVLTGCTEKLSTEGAGLLDAVIFVADDIEDHAKEDSWPEPRRRQVIGRTIEYSRRGSNEGAAFNEDKNKKIRDSSFIRYVERISSPEPCVFVRDSSIEFSKGDSRTDFSAYTLPNRLTAYTLNLAEAYTFELSFESGAVDITAQGPSVACSGWGFCENYWNRGFYAGEDEDRADRKPVGVLRLERAIDLIKKACPGKAS